MKITRIETTPIHVPLKQGWTLKTAHDHHASSPYVIIQVHTDAGLIGLGEATVSPRWSGETSPGCVTAIHGLLEPELVGEDPRNIAVLARKMDKVLSGNPFTKAAIEMALWDLTGKAAGMPVYQLLGGKVRDEMPIRLVIGGFPAGEAEALAKKFLDWGVGCLKVKVGVGADSDWERVRAVRKVAGPDVPITVDANQGWDYPTARRMLRRLIECNILFAEQPIPRGDPQAMAKLGEIGIPIMADESVFTTQDAWSLLQHWAVDIISVYPGKNGGMGKTLAITQMAEVGNVACSMGSNLELGIGTAAMLHLGAALPNIVSERYPGDFIGPLYHQADMLKTPLELGPKAAKVPNGPGLGVELDTDQLEQYRDNSGIARSLS